jgi:hypothetical protein
MTEGETQEREAEPRGEADPDPEKRNPFAPGDDRGAGLYRLRRSS